MFGQILFTQLRWTRAMVAIMAACAFLAPAIAWFIGGASVDTPTSPIAVITGFDAVGPMIAVIGLLGSFLLAVHPWTMDAATRHVQALALPITWRRYASMRFVAGALMLVPPAIALWLGSVLTLSLLTLPPTLRVYPGSLALRFLAATILMYSMVFSLQYIAGRRSVVVLIGILATWALLSFGLMLSGNGDLGAMAMGWLFEFPGPFAVFSADWRLIDV